MKRSNLLAFAGLALTLLSLAGCATYDPGPISRRPSESVINPPRGDRGNPDSYEVFGQRYFVLQSGDGYRDTGTASWYGPDFHGNETSSGERYDMYAYTAAHKTLPIPTWVEVTNRANGRRVIVKVNDRGPFVDNRIIDLSYAAALELGMIKNGTAPVFVRALGAPGNFPERMDPQIAERLEQRNQAAERPVSIASNVSNSTASPASAASGTGSVSSTASAVATFGEIGTYMQVGAYAIVENANRMLERLRENGFVNTVLVSPRSGASSLHLVRIGPLRNASEISFVAESLRSIGIVETSLVEIP